MQLYQITEHDVIMSLSKGRNEKDLEKIFNVRYTTAINWKRIQHRNIEEGYMRVIIEYLKRVSFTHVKEIHSKIGDIETPGEHIVASIIKIPVVEVQKFNNSLVPWKKECMSLLMSVDKRLLKLQRDLLIEILDSQDADFGESEIETDEIKSFFSGKGEGKPLIKLNKEQKSNIKAPPTKDQLNAVSKLAALNGKVIPPKVRLYASRLERWSMRLSALSQSK